MLTVGSLFAGIGGFDLGFERAGMRTLWQVEQSEFCRRVLARHFPEAHRFNDVRDVTGDPRRWAEHGGTLLEYVDVLCGGFPCQDISVAGRGAGIEGERSGLWSEYARLVGELRPRYVVVENVPALLARGLGRVLGDLAALGYDAEWDCIPASAFGAHHRRDRLWLVAYSQRDELREQSAGQPGRDLATVARDDGATRPLADADDTGRRERRRPESVRAEQPAPQRRREALADAESDGRGQRRARRPLGEGQDGENVQAPGVALSASERRRTGLVAAGAPARAGAFGEPDGSGWWAAEPDVGRVANGVPARVDRLRALGNALVPQIAEWIGRRIIEAEGGIAA